MKPFLWVRGAKKEGKIPAIVAGFVVSLALVSSGCSGLVSSTTQPPPPPQLTISNAAVSSVSSTGATITWQTSAAANSQIEYGTTKSYGSMTALDSTVVTSHGESITGLSAGTLYHFRVHSTDANGNQATSGDMTFTTASGTPPTVSITSPTNGATVSGTISVVASASSSVGIASVQFLVDGANFGAPATTSPYTVSLNTTTLSNGNHTLAARAKDTAGNSATSAAITVTVSNTPPPPPTVSITSPTNGATVSGTISVVASASSSVGIASVQFLVDGANFGAPATASPYTVSLNTTALSNGNHTLAATAKDTAGNSATSASITVTVSNMPAGPVISAVASAPSTTSAIITWTTDKPATSQVEYGTTTSYGNMSTPDSTLVTSHSVTLTSLSSSTIYHFRVHSTDANGNSSVSGDFNFTTSSGGGIPPSLGWYQIPNTTLAPNCPSDPSIQGVDGCVAVISAWGGATADTKRNRLLIWGGGHTDYYGNEVYALDLNALNMKRIIDPTSNPVLCVAQQPDGHPTSRHTYYDLAYIANADKMFSFGGAPACTTGIGSDDTWTLDLPTLTWKRQDPTSGGTKPSGGPGLAVVAYDPNTNLVFVEDLSNLYSFNLSTNTYMMLGSVGGVDYQLSGVIDPSRKLLFLIGGPGQLWAINIAPGSNYALQDWSSQASSCLPLRSTVYPGLAFDTKQNLVVGWVGGNSVYLFNPSTKSCMTQTFSGGPGSAQPNGTNGRFAYFPALNLFAVVNDWQQNAYTLRLTQ